MLTAIEKETRQIAMFGCTAEALDDAIAECVEHDGRPANGVMLMMAMSMLSDAQEQIERGQAERARQTINQAKYVIGNVRDELRLIDLRQTNPHLGT